MSKSELLIEFNREVNVFGTGDRRCIIGVAYYSDDGQRKHTKIKGHAAEGELRRNLNYRMYGQWKTHPKYGRQFVFSSFVLSRPLERRAIIEYLKTVPGIGDGRANDLWRLYGEEAIDTLRTKPVEVAKEIRGLTSLQAARAAEELEARSASETVTVELMGLLNGRGFSKSVSQWAIHKWGIRAPDAIKENPYRLIACPGVGFLKADRLYLELGGDPASMMRQVQCIADAANTDTGDTWKSAGAILSRLRANISSAEVQPVEAIRQAIDAGLVVGRTDVDGQKWITTRSAAGLEARVAERVSDLLLDDVRWPDMLDESILSVHQRGKVMKAMQGTVGCLIGTPGTGKSFTAARVVKILVSRYGEQAVAVAAPTGKAAIRFTDLMAEQGLEIEAKTIHRTLGVTPTDGGFIFTHGPDDPLPYKFLVVDEASMLDTSLAAVLLSACGPGTHVLFVGDTNQLPPVGHGAPLRDMILAGVPTGELSEIIRNDGQIVRSCAAIRTKGECPTSEKFDWRAGDNLYLVSALNQRLQVEKLKAIFERVTGQDGRNPIWDVQVVCAVNKNSPVSRESLNKMLQGMLNPNGERDADGKNPFRVGDKVINLKNINLPSAVKDDVNADKDNQIRVANGEMGEVVKVEPLLTTIEMDNPPRLVKVPRGDTGSGGDGDDEASVGTGCSWDLGYAVSVHKSQGSEWPIVIVMLDDSGAASRVCDRAWAYTAISRAEEACLLVGRRSALDDMVRRSNLNYRKTFLVEEIKKHLESLTV